MLGLTQRSDSDHDCKGFVCKEAGEIRCSYGHMFQAWASTQHGPSLHERRRRPEEHRRCPTSDGELHGAGGEAKGVSCCALVSALVSHAEVVDGEGPVLADVELAALRDLDTLLLHH